MHVPTSQVLRITAQIIIQIYVTYWVLGNYNLLFKMYKYQLREKSVMF